MSNHYHVVVKIDRDTALALSDQEVVNRWLTIYSGNEIAQRFNNGEDLTTSELSSLSVFIKKWRIELSNMSRFMAEINQNIARRANREDDCKGRFWETRFDSQAILDVDALLRTLVYVDLNPVRAKIVETPEESRHTSLFRRLNEPFDELIPFSSKTNGKTKKLREEELCLPISFEDYLTLIDWSGRQIRVNKRGVIPAQAPPIFQRLSYSPEQWFSSLQPAVNWKQKALGCAQNIMEYCRSLGQRWIWQAENHKIGA